MSRAFEFAKVFNEWHKTVGWKLRERMEVLNSSMWKYFARNYSICKGLNVRRAEKLKGWRDDATISHYSFSTQLLSFSNLFEKALKCHKFFSL